jgi:IPT/TIG domain
MKYLKNITRLIAFLSLPALLLVTACEKEDETVAPGPPSIEKFRIIPKDSAIVSGNPGLTLAVIGNNLLGTNKVFINDTETYFNPALGTNTSIIVRIATATPWKNTSNKIRVETPKGMAEKEFKINQPAPKITGFNPSSGAAGDVITITGEVFDNLIDVKFGDKTAEVVSKTESEIKVKVPKDVNSEFIYVTTPGGTAKSAKSWGISLFLYQDGIDPAKYWLAGWGNTQVPQSEEVFRGKYSIKQVYNAGWNGFILGSNGPGVVDLVKNNFSAVKISIYGGKGSNGIKLVCWVNDNDKIQIPLSPLEEGKWNDLTIPLDAKFGSPTEFKSIYLMSPGTTEEMTVYIDDIGLI